VAVETIAASGVAPARTVYQVSKAPFTGNAFTSWVEGYLGTRLEDARYLYRYWLEGQATAEGQRAKAIADLMGEKTALMEQRNKLAMSAEDNSIKLAELKKDIRVQQMKLSEARILADKLPESPAADEARIAFKNHVAVAAAAIQAGDTKTAQDAMRNAEQEGRKWMDTAQGMGKAAVQRELAAGAEGIEVVRDASRGKGEDPGPLGVDLGEIAIPSPGASEEFNVTPGGSYSVETSTGARGTPAQVGAVMQGAPAGGGGIPGQVADGLAGLRQAATGGGGYDPEFGGRIDELNQEIERLRGAKFGDTRPTPYDQLMPRAPRPTTPGPFPRQPAAPGARAAEALRTPRQALREEGPPSEMQRQAEAIEPGDELDVPASAPASMEDTTRATLARKRVREGRVPDPVLEAEAEPPREFSTETAEERLERMLDAAGVKAPAPRAAAKPAPRTKFFEGAPRTKFFEGATPPAEDPFEADLRALEEEERKELEAAGATDADKMGAKVRRKVGERYAAWKRAAGQVA
jgi:hypothetical protein